MNSTRSKNVIQKWLPRLVVLVIAGLVITGLVKAFAPQPVKVDLAVIELGPMLVSVEEDGMTRIQERFVVAAPLAGRLQRIQLDPGDTLTAGETLLAAIEPLDPTLLDARAAAEAEARLNAADARWNQIREEAVKTDEELRQAKRTHDRIAKLHQRNAVTGQELDESKHAVRQAEQNVKSSNFATKVAEFELELAKAASTRTQEAAPESPQNTQFTMISPITGRVLRVFQESSKVVSPGENLIELGDPSDLEIVVDVLSSDAVRINQRLQEEGSPPPRVTLEHWGGAEPLHGIVRLVEPSGFTKISALGVEEQRVNVVIDFDEPNELKDALGDGFRVEARIIVWEREDVLIVPTSALFRDEQEWAVFKNVNERAVLQRVTIGQRNGLQAEVLSGLEQGEVVVVHPGDQVEANVLLQQR